MKTRLRPPGSAGSRQPRLPGAVGDAEDGIGRRSEGCGLRAGRRAPPITRLDAGYDCGTIWCASTGAAMRPARSPSLLIGDQCQLPCLQQRQEAAVAEHQQSLEDEASSSFQRDEGPVAIHSAPKET